MEIFYTFMLFFWWILAGLFGGTVGSGSLVSFPLLILIGLPIHTAIATNRFGAVFLEWSSAIRFYKEGKLNLRFGIIFWLSAATWSIIGSNLIFSINERYLNLLTAILLLFVFLILIFKNKLGVQKKDVTKKHWIIVLFLSFLLWIYWGIFWAWFGTLIAFVFILIWLDFIQSAAISRVVWLVMSLSAALVFMYHWAINYPYAIALGLWLAVWGWIGVGFWIKKGNKYIKFLFISILLLTIIKMLIEFFA